MLRWLAEKKHYGMLDDVLKMAQAKGVVSIITLANVAAMIGEVGERTRATKLLMMAEVMGPSKKQEWQAIADAYARMDNVAKATIALSHVGPQEDWDFAAWMTRGRIDMSHKHYREAVVAYGRASELDREDSSPLYFRGLVQLLLGDTDGARADFESCIKLGDQSSQVLGGLGYALFDLARYEEAEERFRLAIKKNEKMADNHLGLALTLFRMGRMDDAKSAHVRAIAEDSVMGRGLKAAEVKGYVYSEVEKKAWEDFLREMKKK